MSKFLSVLLPALLAGCSLIGGAHVSNHPAPAAAASAPAAGMPPEVQRSLNYITSNLDQAERALGSNDAHAGQVHLESAKSELDKLMPENRARPEFAAQDTRYKQLSGQDTDMAASQHKTALGHDALRDASARHRPQKVDVSHDTARHGIAHMETAAKMENECISILDAAFKADPNTAKLVYNGKTGQAIYDSCKAKLAEENEVHDQLVKQEQDKESAIVIKVYKDQWPKVGQFYTTAKKKLGAGDDFSILNANSDIRTALDQADSVHRVCGDVTQLKLESFQLDKTMTAGALCEKSGAIMDEIKPIADDLQKKYDKAYDHVQAKIFASVHGDRARIMKQAGLPSWFDGAALLDSHQWFNAMLRSSYYRYDSSTGCQTTYFFSGNALQRTKAEPLGCSG